MSSIIVPPFTDPELGGRKAQLAEDLWHTRDPEKVFCSIATQTQTSEKVSSSTKPEFTNQYCYSPRLRPTAPNRGSVLPFGRKMAKQKLNLLKPDLPQRFAQVCGGAYEFTDEEHWTPRPFCHRFAQFDTNDSIRHTEIEGVG
jgi:hypothetical protein